MSCNECPVLIVDDDADIRQTLRDMLEAEGYSVDSAANGREGLKCLRGKQLPCLVLLDLTMPVMDGFEFRDEQLRDPQLAAVPVVVITAGRRIEEERPTMDVPVLRKPFDLDQLLGLVRTYC
jgi:CheY-like chemotaxis protein